MRIVPSRDELRDLLESDDEIPSDYDETPYVPAYQNDDRFKNVQLDWKNIIQPQQEISNGNVAIIQQSEFDNDKVLKKGILNKTDIYISKCIERYDDTTLLWFVNFLLLKDLQSKYKFLTSCLVPKIHYDWNDTSCAGRALENCRKQRYKLVVKM